jgi:hypothetical protein
MPQKEQMGDESGFAQPPSEGGPLIRHECRAARIDDVTEFAECLGKAVQSCPHRLTFSHYLYCLHPQREAIIARTMAREQSPGK